MTRSPAPETPVVSALRRDAADDLLALADTMTRLRRDCPWDRTQTVKTLRSYLLEEAHEVLAVLDELENDGSGEPARVAEHRDELGDLLLQIVFQSEIQREAGRFDLGDVCRAINAKLIRRHPHLFGGEGIEGTTPGTQEFWEAMKRREREAAPASTTRPAKKSALDGVPRHLPALLRAYRTGEKARGVGFDWPTHDGVLAKIEEELGEVRQAIGAGDKDAVAAEVGDMLYAITNLARHFEIDAEAALRQTIGRFEERFRVVEDLLAAEGRTPEKATLDELEERWQAAKRLIAARAAPP
ncbi:MAG: nucleoside triphosphate pyrophosphohydrolase [Deltaproteobacteria bacterium]|nr:nucleoside triphosphate pyrophosphohydrolase [Deltaproteobacteria bacterium]